MRTSCLLLWAIAFLLVACDTANLRQYRVARSKPRDRDAVKKVLKAVAEQAGLVDATSTSKVQQTLVLYEEPHVEHFQVDLGARVVAQDIVVDLNAGFGPTPAKFKNVEQILAPALQSAFGTRLEVIPLTPENMIKLDFKP